ncbi:MAG: hypothetical protein ACTHWZ_01760 [Peptoniphilaceae bacterium]
MSNLALDKSTFMTVVEVMESLNVSKPHAYKLIRDLNEELQRKGFITISGRISRKYFIERFYGIS